MLLSRVADSLYWIGRYLERAEHTARLVDVAVDHGLGRAPGHESPAVARIYESLGIEEPDRGAVPLAGLALFDTASGSSVVSCVTAARENARQVREEISSPMWQQLNELYLRVRQMREEGSWSARPHFVSRAVIDGVRLFKGITDGTMGHGEGWHYLNIGRFLERAIATSTLLGLSIPEDLGGEGEPLDQVDWVALLQACCALEAYCQRYTADVRAERVIEFLLLDVEFPRSIRFCTGRLEQSVRALPGASAQGTPGDAVRLAGRLHATLEYALVDEILRNGPQVCLTDVSDTCARIHTALHDSYVAYAIEEALPA